MKPTSPVDRTSHLVWLFHFGLLFGSIPFLSERFVTSEVFQIQQFGGVSTEASPYHPPFFDLLTPVERLSSSIQTLLNDNNLECLIHNRALTFTVK